MNSYKENNWVLNFTEKAGRWKGIFNKRTSRYKKRDAPLAKYLNIQSGEDETIKQFWKVTNKNEMFSQKIMDNIDQIIS